MAAGAAVFLSVAACAVPGQQGQTGTNHVATIISPSPSPSPSPTQPATFAVNGPAFHVGEVGVAYAPVNYIATGGVAPYQWSVSNGALPPGLSIDNGAVSGTPSASGTYAFTLEVTDSGPNKADFPVSITVASALNSTITPACAKYCYVELTCTSACGSFATQSGGVGPFTYQVINGQLPSGTSLSGLALVGTFTGKTGFLQFTVQVTDSLGATDTVSPTFWMYPHIILNGGNLPSNPQFPCWWNGYDPVNAPGCRAQFPYSGGTPNAGSVTVAVAWTSYSQNCTPPPTAAPQPCAPPPMPTVTASGGLVTVTVPFATGYWGSGYQGTLRVVLTNHDPCSAGPTKCSTTALVYITQQGG